MKKFICIVILSILFASCIGDESFNVKTVEDYMPYEKHTKFEYRHILNGTDTTYLTKIVNSRDLIYHGQTVYRVNWYYYNVIIDGEWREYDGMPTDTTRYYIYLKEPIETGIEWFVDPLETDNNSIKYYISATNLNLSTEFGILENCIEISLYSTFRTDKYYYAPGYGKVKSTWDDYSGSHTTELIEVE